MSIGTILVILLVIILLGGLNLAGLTLTKAGNPAIAWAGMATAASG